MVTNIIFGLSVYVIAAVLASYSSNIVELSIFRFIQGVVIGSIASITIFYSLTYKDHQRMHDLLEKHGIEKHEH